MLQGINTQINKIKEEVLRKQILENKLNQLEIELQNIRQEIERLEKSLEKEKRDVDNLNKASIANILSTVLGNKEEKIKKEQEEYIEAQIKYENSKAKEELIYSQIIDIETRLRYISNYEKEYEELIKQKRKLISTYKDIKTIDKIIDIEETIDKCIKDTKEIEESILIGDKLLYEIKKSKEYLNAARNWSAVDILGGGVISSISKHDRLKEGQRNFSKISTLANHFKKELKDISIESIEISNATKAWDIYFDTGVDDISVGIEILKVHKEVSKLEKDVENIITNLKENKIHLNDMLNLKRNKYDSIIKDIK